MGRSGLQNPGGNPTSSPFRNGPYVWDQQITFTAGVAGANTQGSVYYADSVSGTAGGDGKSWGTALSTIQACVDLCGDGTGDVIYVAGGNGESATRYNENVIIIAKRGLRIIGVGGHKNVIIRVSGGSPLYPVTPVGQSAATGVGMLILSSNVEVSGISFDASGAYIGVYIGDGYRVDNSYDYDTENCKIYNCTFKYGAIGIAVDGGAGDSEIFNNYFYKQSDIGIHIAPGGTRTSVRIRIHDNDFMGCEDYGVYLYDTTTTINIAIGPRNVFADHSTDTTSMTAPIYSNNAAHFNQIVGNWFVCNTSPTVGAKDWISGNFKGAKGSYVDIAEA